MGQVKKPKLPSLQVVFNRAWKHFIVDRKKKSMDKGGMCMYRADRTASCPERCVIGLIIPDKSYKPIMDCFVFRTVLRMVFETSSIDLEPYTVAQEVLHDNRTITSKGTLQLKEARAAYLRFAKEYNLQVPKQKSPQVS